MSSTYIVTQSFKILFFLRAEIYKSFSVMLWRAARGKLTLTSFALFILGARKLFKSQPLSFSRTKAASQLLRSTSANAGAQAQFSAFDFKIIFYPQIYNDHKIRPLHCSIFTKSREFPGNFNATRDFPKPGKLVSCEIENLFGP